ncbi:GntR family transcriptional regulator [Bacillus sp. AFS076308]|uniref:GntR family transcriptional regulator n=1 Tax=unclassified Bacillus (in: firmicutes) TaxID=185979 RepID=UPI000BFA9034|nr:MULTISPECIES: GntR family transcriptional regulator [unclassified Bacillus (in: firmicutes)]PFN97291.1 GntR family transcriptional regulator [Bacillus sp. AFS076308]PGV51721.1 GntR family transcriptional regulator [Bacillus sp. AFS037270]
MAQKTKYNMVKEKITEWITSGKVQPGEKIYSENELVKMFGVSRHTVRQAVGDLVHEGWLYREQGAGTFCSNKMLQPNVESEMISPIKSLNTNGKNIGVITTYISDYIFPSIIKGIESYLTAQGYSLTFACTDNDVEKEKQCLQTMLSRNIDGLIVEPTRSSNYNPNIHYYLQLEQNNIPYLMINQFYSQLMPPHIIMNDEHGGFIATEHLINLGHEKIIGLFKTDDLQGVNRMQGFIRAFREHNLPFFPDMVITYTTEQKDNNLVEQLQQFFTTDDKPTAIVCYNDQLALQVLFMLRGMGLSVPEDVSIVGYDDSSLAEATDVKLTSVTHPKMDMGIEAAKWIVSAVEKRGSIEHSTIYEPELVVRNSTSALDKNQ